MKKVVNTPLVEIELDLPGIANLGTFEFHLEQSRHRRPKTKKPALFPARAS